MINDLSARIRNACVGHPYAKIEWPHRILHEAADEVDIRGGEIAKLREALNRQGDNMAFVINNVSLPDQWRDKFMRELDEDRAALEGVEL